MEKIIFIILLVCIILLVLLVLYGLVRLAMCYIDIFLKKEKPRNKVHFYVTRDGYGTLELWLGKPKRWEISKRKIWFPGSNSIQIPSDGFNRLGINVEDFTNLKWEDEPVGVFLNLED